VGLVIDTGVLEAALLGAGFGLGLALLIAGLIGRPVSAVPREPSRLERQLRAWRAGLGPVLLGSAAGAGIAAYLLTGWPSAALLAVLAVLILPKHLGKDSAAAGEQAKIEAVATWTQQLAGTMSAAAALEQAIVAASETAPPALRTAASGLAGRIRQGERTPVALATFADEVADETCDLVVAALISASRGQAGNVGQLLGQLADTAGERVEMRLRTGAERAKVRAQVRAVIIVVLVTVAAMCLAARSYLAPYASPLGQLVLLAVGAIFAASFAWMTRISRPAPARRLLTRFGKEGA
jgi:Flp pilus assembly protein TadB